MGLRGALLILGLLVVAIVALNAYDRGRIKQRLLAMFEARFKGLGVIPEAPAREAQPPWNERRVLRPDAPPPAPEAKAEGSGDEELDEPFGSIDFICFLPGDVAVERDTPLGIYKQSEYLIDKPHRLYGQREGGRAWANLSKDPQTARYGLLALALQLADRSGAVNESELNAISQIGLKLADTLNRPTRFNMTFEQALERAGALDKFCSEFDVIATVNVLADSAPVFRGPAIERAAHEARLEFGTRNIFHRKNPEAGACRYLYSLANLYQPGSFDPLRLDVFQTQGLTLFMSVPSVPDPLAVFMEMVHSAQVLARRLGGRLFDADRKPLSEAGLRAIQTQIRGIVEQMVQHGITPGSVNAVRLFPP
ncbi:cell division protein ZipA C-terminal FtsZ-binding domain-containing protein [Acidiferrobacter sp.]|uniref:cell division protein ZipA C-terminal FtsZ-binding domain-containing protein n=1 Tax=Acidiferrobacter sp. TaxID=1872107 RepID=UPI00262616A9|nr:cell division protein ZipA C-terminal FtsZ-binding domain-containing protein [Acidiferrobacter sp.]